jgi:ketosteroid isomerase-like protein
MPDNVELAKRAYAAVNEAYEQDSVELLKAAAEEMWADDGVLVTSGRLFPEAGEWPGREGFLRFTAQQMEAFERMWLKPLEFITAGDTVVVRVQLGGIARHTGITMEFELYHVIQYHDGKIARLEAHIPRADALGAAGLSAEG